MLYFLYHFRKRLWRNIDDDVTINLCSLAKEKTNFCDGKSIEKMDVSKLGNYLLYSHELHFAQSFEGNKFRLSENRCELESETPGVNYSEFKGSVILCNRVVKLERNEIEDVYGAGVLKLKYPIDEGKYVPKTISVYKCNEKWKAVEVLKKSRHQSSHSARSYYTLSEFKDEMEKIKEAYNILGFPVKKLKGISFSGLACTRGWS